MDAPVTVPKHHRLALEYVGDRELHVISGELKQGERSAPNA